MSTLKADTIQSTSGGAATLTKQYAAKMIINYDHAAATIRSSANVSSVADDATGKFTISYTSSMNDANYSPSAVCLTKFDNSRAGNFVGLRITDNGVPNARSQSLATGTLAIDTAFAANPTENAGAVDNDANCVQVFGDLA